MTAPVPPPEPGESGFQPSADPNDPAAPVVAFDSEAPYEDYFGFDETKQWFFPDKKQYIEFKIMTEGDRAKYQSITTRDVTVLRESGDAKMKVDPGTDRKALFECSVVGWHIMKRDPRTNELFAAPFTIGSPGAEFEKWLSKANPVLVDELERTIRDANPWLGSEETVEDIDKELDRLRERKDQLLARQRGESSSSSR